MDSESKPGPIAWDRVKERLPGTARELVDEIQNACEERPDEPARAIEMALRSRIAGLRNRFRAASGGES